MLIGGILYRLQAVALGSEIEQAAVWMIAGPAAVTMPPGWAALRRT